jgi:hypothetical protein
VYGVSAGESLASGGRQRKWACASATFKAEAFQRGSRAHRMASGYNLSDSGKGRGSAGGGSGVNHDQHLWRRKE